jgi:hypothetical protein
MSDIPNDDKPGFVAQKSEHLSRPEGCIGSYSDAKPLSASHAMIVTRSRLYCFTEIALFTGIHNAGGWSEDRVTAIGARRLRC